jgi:hypothetical protein
MRLALLIILLFASNFTVAQKQSNKVITTDIDNFWIAYDQIIATNDSSKKYEILNRAFISKGTPGLKAMMAARSYTNKSYIDAIQSYPLYWKSIRGAMFEAKNYSKEIAKNIGKLKAIYPALKPAKIYFTLGAFRSGGTITDSLVLIGSEIAMADDKAYTKEFESANPNLASFLRTSPVNFLVFTNVHEYVHTQQKTTIAQSLLGQCLLEGVAEFIAEKATGKQSKLPALAYGKANKKRIAAIFGSQIFNTSNGYWLYSDSENEFKMRDLGYYVGYAICERYYDEAPNKMQSIKEMIELDYNDQNSLIKFVDQANYFEDSLLELSEKYEANRPTVIAIDQVLKDKKMSASLKLITIRFSEEMDKRFRNFELGPLGEGNILRIKRMVGFSEDGKSLTFEVDLAKDKQYQLVVGAGFRNLNGSSLKPYLIDFKTILD